MIYKASEIAEYLLALVCNDEGDLISNLKLQKLLYYAQGFSLAINDKILFEEKILAWRYGPVVEEVYQIYRENGSGAIDCPVDFDFFKYDEGTQDLLEEVYSVYGQYTATALMRLTHEEPPWQETELNKEIQIEQMKKFFLTLVVES